MKSYQLQSDYLEDEQIMLSQICFNKQRDGSLLDLFESPLFDVHKLFSYLHKLTNRPNMIEYLVNKLYKEYRNDVKVIDFYLP